MAVSKSTFIPIEDDWIIETGKKNNGSGGTYHYLLHKHHDNDTHGTYSRSDRSAITIPDPTERQRICAGCNEVVPTHIAGLLILCRWEV